MDVLSFVLGVALTVGTMYLVSWRKEHRQANKHILGWSKAKYYTGRWGPREGQDWGPLTVCAPYSIPPSVMTPDTATPPTAPYPGLQKPPVAIPCPSNATQWTSWSNKISYCFHRSLLCYILINYGRFTSSQLCGSSFNVQMDSPGMVSCISEK